VSNRECVSKKRTPTEWRFYVKVTVHYYTAMCSFCLATMLNGWHGENFAYCILCPSQYLAHLWLCKSYLLELVRVEYEGFDDLLADAVESPFTAAESFDCWPHLLLSARQIILRNIPPTRNRGLASFFNYERTGQTPHNVGLIVLNHAVEGSIFVKEIPGF
jgi:hypothetical protein